MFKADDGGTILGDMLRKAGIQDNSKLELLPTWKVFGEFVKLPFITKTDHIMVEWGTYPQWVKHDGKWMRDGEVFHFHFCRQLDEPDGDEYIQIGFHFDYEPNTSLRGYGRDDKWWFVSEEEPPDEFITQIESLPIFQDLVKNQKPKLTSMNAENT